LDEFSAGARGRKPDDDAAAEEDSDAPPPLTQASNTNLPAALRDSYNEGDFVATQRNFPVKEKWPFGAVQRVGEARAV
jgi:hypothetical protein